MRDHVVELARDPLALVDDRGLGLRLLPLEPLLAVAPESHHHAREPGAAHDEGAEHDVAPHEPIAVVPDELDGDGQDEGGTDPGLDATGVRAERVEREHADDDEDRRVLVEAG